MSEAWAVAFAGFAFTALAWGVNRIATKLDELTKRLNEINNSLSAYVRDAECNERMGTHCRRLNDLEQTVRENTQSIKTMEDRK